MTVIEVTSFSKVYKYIDKIEDDNFTIRYRIYLDVKIAEQSKAIKTHDSAPAKPIKKEQYQVVAKQKEPTDRGTTDRKDRKIDTSRKQLQQLKKYEKVNMKAINVIEDDREEEELIFPQPKKKKYSKANREGQETPIKPQKKEHRHRIQSEGKNKQAHNNHQPTFEYNDYLSLDQILKSCQLGERKYFKGRVEYGQGPKGRGKIVSDQIEGPLIIEGKHRNRTLHDDQVYFSIIHKEDDRINCTVHHILPSKRVIVGKVSIIQSKGIYVLTPINCRIAAMNARPEHVPKNIAKSMKTHYYMGEFLGWDKKDDYPYCHITKQFGKFGDIDVETSSLLKIHNLEDADYDNDMTRDALQQFLKTVDEKGEYIISDEQIDKREDLRQSRIFTIDPHNSRDFDDAISVQKIGQHFKVGVHIADASFFVQQGSKIDEEARKRTTSVYLVHKVIPMLPRLLCENFCSLNPGRTRLTFTIWMKLDQQGKMVETPSISRSVIRSKARFTYEQAQKIIDGTIKDQGQIEEGFGCVKSEQFTSIASDILTLHELASQLRKRRVERGSLFFQIPRKVFRLDQTSNPIDFSIYQRKQAHFLVEELMILANEQIGEVLVKSLGAQALLRRHKYPGAIKIERFQAFMKKIGMPLEISKDTRVQDTLNSVLAKEGVKQTVKDIIKYETISLLQAADYFIVGQSDPASWIHYALNSPVYTHFTSPIRRYPDILVHRQLAAILNGKDNLKAIPKQLIDLCNQKKLQAKRVSNGCEKIFMCLHLRKAEVMAKGIICEANHWGIKICIPRFDFKGTLRFQEINDLSVLTVETDTVDRRILKMEYKANKTKDGTKFILKELQEVEVKLSCKQGFPLDYQLTLIMPHPQLIGQHLLIQ